MSETEDVLSEWLGLDSDEIARCAVIIRHAVEVDQVRERFDEENARWGVD